ncbi:PQQ-binding-like beta-propeller repeat protein, partial [bacterium]|nr:PQQ-binding-like beta-propeller repeat protein [candidate division CSSED10-310 bacterium]
AGNPLQSYDVSTGDLKWTYGGTQTGWAPQPTVTSNGTVLYLQGITTSYLLHAVNGLTGTKIWESPLQFELGWSDANIVCLDEERNQVLMLEFPFAPDSGKLYVMDIDSGAVKWYLSKALNGFSMTGNYLVRKDDTVYAGIVQESWSRERIGVINLTTHALDAVWPNPAETYDTYINSITLCGDALAVTFRKGNGEPGGDLVIYDTADGSVRWTYTVTQFITGDVAYNAALDRLYLPTEPRLIALDLDQTAGDVQPAWIHTGYGAIYSPSIAGGIVYFLSDTNAYALNETTGTVLRSFPLGEPAYEGTQVAVCDGSVYFSGNGGTCDLYAYGFPPECSRLGVTITMPAHHFTWTDSCSCTVDICNPGSTALTHIPLFVLLDVYGTFYFAPGFTETPTWYTVNPVPGWSEHIVLPEFEWPYGTSTAEGLMWYAAMTNQEITSLLGDMSTWQFGWS